MKNFSSAIMMVVAALVLVATLSISPAMAGDGCGSKQGCSMSAACCPAGVDCPPECCMECPNPGSCSWDHSQWKGVRYSNDGQLSKQISERQARKVVREYLKKSGMKGIHLGEVSDNGDVYTVAVKNPGACGLSQLQVAKKTAWVRSNT